MRAAAAVVAFLAVAGAAAAQEPIPAFERPLTVRSRSGEELPAGHPVRLALDLKFLSMQGKVRADLTDLRIERDGASVPCRAEAVDGGPAVVWFSLARPLQARGEDAGYRLVYGGPPPWTREAPVSLVCEDFDGPALNGDRWRASSELAWTLDGGALAVFDTTALPPESWGGGAAIDFLAPVPEGGWALEWRFQFPTGASGGYAAVAEIAFHEDAEAVPAPVQAAIAAALVKLGADDWNAREEGQRELVEIGRPAMPALRKAMEDPDPEVRARSAAAMESLAQRFPPPVARVGVRVGPDGQAAAVFAGDGQVHDSRAGVVTPEGWDFRLLRTPEGDLHVFWSGARLSSAKMPGPVERISFRFSKIAGQSFGGARLDRVLLRPWIDPEPSTELGIETRKP